MKNSFGFSTISQEEMLLINGGGIEVLAKLIATWLKNAGKGESRSYHGVMSSYSSHDIQTLTNRLNRQGHTVGHNFVKDKMQITKGS